jgi:AraC-like DNA-binding protein
LSKLCAVYCEPATGTNRLARWCSRFGGGENVGAHPSKSSNPWTLAALAKEVGVSRSVLAERFRHYLNEPPMAYLTRWRLQLGGQMLSSTNYTVAQIAAEVGYESEAAFNRAFKREFTIPPARFRSQSRSSPGEAVKASTITP